MLRRILELETRGINISAFCDEVADNEHEKIARLIRENYGQDNTYYKAAMKGIFAHHRGISNGVRVATEYAMRKGLIKCIVCTSTLAQGVNLPIRYLIISSLYQAQEQIKVRDFHNLIGRAGRAGLYTEGTILLSETFVYSKRTTYKEGWRWRNYLKMLNPDNSESCLSQFLLLVRPQVFKTATGNRVNCDFYSFVLRRYNNAENHEEFAAAEAENFIKKHSIKMYDLASILSQINCCADAIESYLLSFLTDNNNHNLDALISGTFGYFLATEEEQERMRTIFSTIRDYLLRTLDHADKRAVFSRTLLGTKQLLKLESWIVENSDELRCCETTSEILRLIMEKIVEYSENKCLKDIIAEEAITDIASMWIDGASYKQILDYATENNVRIIRRNKEANILLEEIIDVCDDGFGYASILIINAISELLRLHREGSDGTCEMLGELGRQMRYGLPTKKSILIYELGFGDRAISLRLATILQGDSFTSKKQFQRAALKNKDKLMEALDGFPKVFSDRMVELAM